ncbi:MAG: hypothetical protein CMB31_05630 [Euryarchaeota archaeon]|nr:hypothetical protein [Euryarchaeota archaeon]
MFPRNFIVTILFVSVALSPLIVQAEGENVSYTLSGNVYDQNGNIADSTSIKVDSMSSVWSNLSDGSYEFTGISPGEHTVRAYFMNNGHTVVYRKMFFSGDMQLDWHVGKSWATAEMFDDQGERVDNSALSTIQLLELEESHILDDGRTEFGLLNLGDYYTLIGEYGEIDGSTQYVHFKLEPGSATTPSVNDFDFHHGMNSRYGFITDNFGNPLTDVVVSNGEQSVVTNTEGFYLLQNLPVGLEQNYTFTQGTQQVIDPFSDIVQDGPGWLNFTSNVEVEMPGNVTFVTQMQTITSNQFEIKWDGGEYTDFYSLYQGEVDEENLIYRGYAESFIYNPEDSGTIEFRIVANNSNGSTENLQPLLLIVLLDGSNQELWSPGMSWNYSVLHTPEYHQNKTYTVIGSEVITDAFNREQDTFLLRVSDENYEEGEKAYRWVDSQNLLNVKTYWVDAPSSSSYFQEGQFGWNFTNNGQEVDLLSADPPTSLHFNRTNIIGVPGHPNGYDDTINSITVEYDVEVSTPAGIFDTTHISIVDENDDIVSWELWYNSTVRNYVKIVDRLPGSHSEMVEYELTSFDVPLIPQFITEESNLSINDFTIEWANFQGAESYQLLENSQIIYSGNLTSLDLVNQPDGDYTFRVNAIMPSGHLVEGETLSLHVHFVQSPPTFVSSTQNLNGSQEVQIEWTSVEDSAWYSLIVNYSDGTSLEIYNGTSNHTIVDDLDEGQNRLRVKVGLSNGIESTYSDSIYLMVESVSEIEPNSNRDNVTPQIVLGFILILFALFAINRSGE